MNSSCTTRFFTAALLASMAMATNMGCQLDPDSPGSARDKETGVDAGPPEEPNPPDPQCSTFVDSWRFMCTICSDGRPTECVAAHCSTDGAGCYTCEDENGNTVSDCGVNLDCASQSASATGSFSFSVCETVVCPDGTATKTCNYPGSNSCETSTDGDVRCVDCTYPDGNGMGVCAYDPTEPLPDPFADRPTDLPAPGTCVTEASPGGFWSCTTCTDEDGLTTSECSYAASSTCTAEWRDDGRLCSNCTYPDGTDSSVCLTVRI